MCSSPNDSSITTTLKSTSLYHLETHCKGKMRIYYIHDNKNLIVLDKIIRTRRNLEKYTEVLELARRVTSFYLC